VLVTVVVLYEWRTKGGGPKIADLETDLGWRTKVTDLRWRSKGKPRMVDL